MKFLTLILSAVLLPLSTAFATITVHSDRWMPMNGTPLEETPGYAIELLVNAFTDDEDLTYVLEPWADSLDNVAKGKAQVVIGAAKDEAPNLIFPVEPVAHVQYGLWAKKDSTFVYSKDALAKIKVGVVKGYTYWADLDALVKDNAENIVSFSGENALADAIDALQKGEIDLFPESIPVFTWGLKDAKLDKADFVTKHAEDGGLIYVAFTNSTRGRELADKWDAKIAEFRKDGTLAAILAKYEVSDWKE